ncbi:MAG TPA: hypothetical protein VIJ18_10730 [Microbacteriaceae bacterium]
MSIDAITPDEYAGLPLRWAALSAVTALFAGGGSLVALLLPAQIYGQETSTLFDAAVAQDMVNLFLVWVVVFGLAVFALAGTRASLTTRAGTVTLARPERERAAAIQ